MNAIDENLATHELDSVAGGFTKIPIRPGYTLVITDNGGLHLCGPKQCVPLPSNTYPFRPPA